MDDRQVLFYNLCLVSRRLNSITTTYLYRSPRVHWLSHADVWFFTGRLARTLLYRPVLRNMVRNLELFLPDYSGRNLISRCLAGDVRAEVASLAFDTTQWEQALVRKELYAWAALLILLTPRLLVLSISASTVRNLHKRDHATCFVDIVTGLYFSHVVDCTLRSGLTTIRNLTLHAIEPTLPLCALPSLQTLEIETQFALPELDPGLETFFFSDLVYHHLASSFFAAPDYISVERDDLRSFIEKCKKLNNVGLYYKALGVQWESGPSPYQASYANLAEVLYPVASTLEHLNLTCQARDKPINRAWLRQVEPLESLTRLYSLKSLNVFGEALHRPYERNPYYRIAQLPSTIEHLWIQRPTLGLLEDVNGILKHRSSPLPHLSQIALRYEPDEDLPTPRELFESKQREELLKIGLFVPVYWSSIDHSPSGFEWRDASRIQGLEDGMMRIE
ncbi:hypothetical protein FB567DRAFT_604908 [Paraphoma chrysanthemicola]|uniref:Uncharacterized protein n=1 Tax=Paraphoma chrysanthemicola TaxID=798071 RepID=A0A8K0R115_9PLEO|nr:hypothetical protein FB567DRAFT_604908 [Paraphoma chrysanthemicola]